VVTGDRNLGVELIAVALEQLVRAHLDVDVQVAGGTTLSAGATLAAQPNPVPVIHPGGYLDLQRARLANLT